MRIKGMAPERAFRHIAGMIGKGGVTLVAGVYPLMTTCGLVVTVEALRRPHKFPICTEGDQLQIKWSWAG
jgi:hypothetical protein